MAFSCKKISIVGFGRFGKTLYKLLKDDFEVAVFDKKKISGISREVAKIYDADAVFYAVPIGEFEKVILEHKKFFTEKNILIDVLSVKMHPAKILNKYLKGTKIQAILTHPMFGPDSVQHGFKDLPIILDKFRSGTDAYAFWKKYFIKKGLRIIEMSAGEHDKLAAHSQGLTHFIGRLLDSFGFEPTKIDSLGAKKLFEVKSQTCNDTWELFNDLQHYNPHTKQMRIKLGDCYDNLYNKLLPRWVDEKVVVYGIQGGKGSFNEEAIMYYIRNANIERFKIKYLYTTENVMKALHNGEIDVGQFAIHNSVGGIVDESIQAMSRYKFRILKEFAIKISHALMIRRDAKMAQVKGIMTHSQVVAQCEKTLAEKYPNLKYTEGKGKMIDPAMVAKYLAEKKLPNHVATMGSSIIAKIYGLQIVEDNLQDAKENYTSFLHVVRM
ncbi:MAG: prephenate dehydrogenase/arogenate dehydrogenase family protein [Candidatus Gracilibacteria bacterium]